LITVAGLCYTSLNLVSLSNVAVNNLTFIQGG
jgi:hypothetical protein